MNRLPLIGPPIAAVCLWCFQAVFAAPREPGPLRGFLPDAEATASLELVIGQLESDSFAEREAASRQLEALDALPAFIRELAAVGKLPPESNARLRDLVAKHPIERENQRLSDALQEIVGFGIKGELAAIAEVMGRELWQPSARQLHRAAATTVVPADLPWLEQAVGDDSAVIRRLAAAALGGLPAADSKDLLERCLDDPDEACVLLAANALAEAGNPQCLAAFARLLESDQFQIRYRSAQALRELTGEKFNFDPALPPGEGTAAAWQEWAASPLAAITGPLPNDEPIHLFYGRNLDAWELYANGKVGDIGDVWQIDRTRPGNETLHCSGKVPGDLWSKSRFDDYVLTLDYKIDQAGHDGGIGVLLTREQEDVRTPGYLEVQILPGKAGDLYQIGSVEIEVDDRPLRFLHQRNEEVRDPVGSWNHLEISVRSGRVEVRVNGSLVNQTSKGPLGPGRIVLRNEGHPVWFRDVMLHPGVER